MLRRTSGLGFGLALFCLWVPLSAPAAPPPLIVSGVQILTSAGCTVLLKGANLDGLEFSSNGFSGSWPGSLLSVAQMAVTGWGCNVVRLPLDQDWWFGCSNTRGSPTTTSYRAIVDSIVQFCSDNNAYVVLDLHWSGTYNGTSPSSPCDNTSGWGSANGQQEMPDANAVTFWKSVAAPAFYGNNPAVIFDLYNEPHGVSFAVWQSGGSTGGTPAWTPGMQGLLNAVRSAGSTNVCLVGGLNFSKDFSGLNANPITGTNFGYSAHLYGNQVGNTSSGWVVNYVTQAMAKGPLFIGEFAPSTSCNTDDPTYDSNMFAWIGTQAVVGGTAWSMTTNSCPNLYTGAYVPNAFGAAVTAWLATPVPNCIYTLTPTPTQTPCGYPGNTCTPTDTPTATNTPTVTDTPTATSTPFPNTDIPWPNPWDGSAPLTIQHSITTPADSVQLKVYTIAFRKICEVDNLDAGKTNAYPVYTLSWDQMGNVANGLYYLVIEEKRGRKQNQIILKLLVQR